ncbi:TPA: hypothetical protein DCX16_05655 [bacterium]|nr:hypothetical protein [bacterium]
MQRTIDREVSISGIGLHTGEQIEMTLKSAPENTGIVFIRKDMNKKVPAKLSYIFSSYREIALKKEDAEVHTVEHLLATLTSFSITNLFVELGGPEPPAMDGSGLSFVKLIEEAGVKNQGGKIKVISINRPIEIVENGRSISIYPYDGFKISYTVAFDHPVVQSQSIEIELSEEGFIKEIAPARTFGFLDEVSLLREKGLIKGGSLDNAVVVGHNEILNKEALRFPNEFVRHKVLDLIGDMSLLGTRLKGHIVANCSGHSMNIKLARRLDGMVKSREEGVLLEEKGGVIDIKDIIETLPHRYPFLFVDRILEIVPGKRIVGIKNVAINEQFFSGHFPGRPVMPGVLIIEAMAQTAGVLLLSEKKNKGKFVWLAGLDKVRFRKPVTPGDQIRFEITPIKVRSKVGIIGGKAYVDGELVAEAELLFSIE